MPRHTYTAEGAARHENASQVPTGGDPSAVGGARRGGSAAKSGVTLIELLCVIAIIAILASMLLPAVTRAFSRIKGKAEEIEAPEIAYLLKKQTQDFCIANPRYQFESKSDFVRKCPLAPKCKDWVNRSRTEFVAFSYQDSTNMVVLTVRIGERNDRIYSFTKGMLSIRPDGS